MLPNRDMTRPMEVVLIANEKGGVGKTTTTLCLGNCLTALGYSVLIADMDPSANLSVAALPLKPTHSLYNVFDGSCTLPDILVKTPFGYIAPSNKEVPDLDGDLTPVDSKSLTQIANRLIGVRGGEYMLNALLRKSKKYDLNKHFDFVLLDSAPSDNILILNSIIAANSVIVPVELSAAAVDGLQMFLGSISNAHAYYKTNVGFDGMLIVKYSEDTSSERKMAAILDNLCEAYDIPRYDTRIRHSATMRSALDNCKPILDYLSNGHGAEDSMNMTLEFLRNRGLTPRVKFPGVRQDNNGQWFYKRPSKTEKSDLCDGT